MNTSKENPVKSDTTTPKEPQKPVVKEIGGVDGPEPTRYNDWERNGKCVDF